MTLPIHICHFTTVHPRDDVRVFYKQCISLAKEGLKVTLIVADGKGNEFRNGVDIIDIGKSSGGRFTRITKSSKTMFNKLLQIDADIYQFHDPELLSTGGKLKKLGKNVVFDSHEDVPKQILYKTWLGPLFFRKFISKQYNKYEKRKVKQFDGLISVIDEITSKFECQRKVTVKNYPISAVYSEFLKPYKDKKNQFVYVGSLTQQRGIKDCIEAMKFIPENYQLVLIGSFPSEEFKKQCTSLPEWQRVDYKGFLPMDKVAPIIGESLVGLSVLHPEENYKTSLPTKAFEYMAAGTPVVLSNFEYWKPYFKNCGAFVSPMNSKIIADAIMELIKNPTEYQNIQEICIQKAKEYSWESEVNKLIQLYKDILS